MADRERLVFLGIAVVLTLGAAAAIATAGPPDADTQVQLLVAAVISLAVSYLLVYRAGVIDR